jgi:predicted nucleic acid-binding protein
MTQRYGIDTSILVRLVTGLPEQQFEATLEQLSDMVERQGAQLVATNMVIGEAYIAMQHHYGLAKADVRKGLLDTLSSGLIAPANGSEVLNVIKAAARGCGLMDRLIAQDCEQQNLKVLTLDRKMAGLSNALRIKV